MAGAAVAVVLGAAILTSILPTGFQEVVFHTPLAIIVLIVGHRLAAVAHLAPSARADRSDDRTAGRDAGARTRPPRAPPGRSRRAHPETWDVVIVGGGIVGCRRAARRRRRAGCGRRSSSRTTSRAGTSSRSSRLIHGGLRYLEQFHFGLVREALAERSRLLAIAPHLVRIEPLLFPIYGIPFLSTMFYDAGLTLYDMLGARRDGGWHRRLSKAATLELAPTLRPEGLRGGLLYSDGVEDDARYTLAVARTALAAGAVAVTRVRATGLRTEARCGVHHRRSTPRT